MAKKVTKYFVYILECKDGTLYTGIATDVTRRFTEHKNGTGAKYTRSRGAKRVIYKEKYRNRSAALKREAQIKNLTRDQKKILIASD
jgi:putative endonuclease